MTDTGASAWSRPCVCDVDTRSCLRHNRAHETPPSRILASSLSFECVYFATGAITIGDEHTCGFGHPDRFTHSDGDRYSHSHRDTAAHADVHPHAAAR